MSIQQKPAAKPSPTTDESNGRAVSSVNGVHVTEAKPAVSPSASSSGYGWLIWIVLIGGTAGGWYTREQWLPYVGPYVGLDNKPPAKPPVRVIPVVTAKVVQKDMQVYINGLGTVTAFKTVTIRSRVEGELVKVAFTEGQIVREGDLLAEIDRRPFDVQLQQAEGQLARDEATLKAADFTFKRYEELQAQKAIAAQQVDDQRSIVQQTTGAIQSDRATVANAKLQLDYCHITAPISGRIGLRLVDQGNIVRANDPNGIAVITQLQPIALVFTIPQDDISRVQKANRDDQPLVVTAFDRNFKTKLALGKLSAIDNQVDATTGTVRLKAVFDNEDGLLFPNQFVNARLLVDTKKDAIVVPTAAVQRGPNFSFVYVVQEDETVELRNVTVGMSEGAESAIESGLAPGEVVVTEGLDKLQKGTKITTSSGEQSKDGKGKGEKGQDSKSKGDHKKGDPTNDKHRKDAGQDPAPSGKSSSTESRPAEAAKSTHPAAKKSES
ncbi:MdtA/MuxA family multidrug efflux RND transporter periplasmic adaptor subunit [Schlesneria paludicola]|uniref:MdtA/MuxA family multidrug efflux RND transporter periplasmic adaptor subunit n=1 Tax=Schlesneria paludicola TaxID=360056 RepID=UPI0012FCDB18|nr:MdtA/MuxA family multidrug efflux RND transporter periplasmic adaptor subunit [Schlesneria paludicola]